MLAKAPSLINTGARWQKRVDFPSEGPQAAVSARKGQEWECIQLLSVRVCPWNVSMAGAAGFHGWFPQADMGGADRDHRSPHAPLWSVKITVNLVHWGLCVTDSV